MQRRVKTISIILLALSVVTLAGNHVAQAASTIGLRMPFVGSELITNGPGCSSTHMGVNSEAIDYGLMYDLLFAAEGGTVTHVGSNEEAGEFLRIYHPVQGAYSFYAHLDFPWVSQNQLVNKGQLIGVSGSSGLSTAPHLHFEVETEPWLQTISIRDLPRTIWNDPNNVCLGGTAKGSQVSGRVGDNLRTETQWPRVFWPMPAGDPVGPWMQPLVDTPDSRAYAYTDGYGYFHLFDLPTGSYRISAEKFHWRGSNPDPLISPTAPISTCAEHPSASDLTCGEPAATILIISDSPTTMNDVKLRRGDTDACGNDNRIDICDYSALVMSFFLHEGDPGYDRSADFSEDDFVDIEDFSVLKTNFGAYGSDPPVWTPLVQNGA